MKLSKEEKEELKGYIKFENGLLSDKDQLQNDLIKFINKKYRQKYKQNDDKYEYIISQLPPDSDGEVKRLVLEDNEFYERVSIVLYQESIKDRRSRDIKTKNESRNIEPIATNDIGEKRQYLPHYKMNGEIIYLTFESSDDYSEQSKTRWKIESVYAKEYSEVERTIDNAINSLFEQYYNSNNKNEVLYKLLVHINDNQLDYFSQEALIFFLNQELNHYHILDNQQKVLDRILLCGEIPDANQKKILKRLLRIAKKK